MAIVTNETESVRTSSAVENGPNASAAKPSLQPMAIADSVDDRTWQQELRAAIRDAETLCRKLDIWQQLPADRLDLVAKFPVFVPEPFLNRMRSGNPDDPLLRQVLPLAEESRMVDGFSSDPVQELAATRTEGLIHKYHGRALLIAATVCAVHCRYCFRREFPYDTAPHSLAQWQPAMQEIASDPSIEEVILSGGDPLMLVDNQVAALIRQIDSIKHVRRIRIHTRLPIVIPSRVTDELICTLRQTDATAVVVVHANHANELDQEVADALARFTDNGISVLNQAVLLHGVNDSAEALHQLFARLADLRVLPYYLHQLDRVNGAAHFEVPVETGLQLMRQLHQTLPGYLLPRYVTDDGGRNGKRILF